MTLRGYTVKQPIDILSKDEVNRVHAGSLEVLEHTGVVFEHKGALQTLADAGCKVDHEKRRVRFPSYLVEECIRKCPSSFSVKAREAKNDLRLGGHNLYYCLGNGMDTTEVDTGKRVTASLQQVCDAVRVTDCLDELALSSAPVFNIEDVPAPMYYPTAMACCVRNSSKAFVGASGYDIEIWAIKLAQATNQELWFASTSTAPPLSWDEMQVTAALRYIEAGQPLTVSSGHVWGANSPVTIAGSLVQNNAELLSMIVLAQVVSPGLRCSAMNYSAPMDMRTAVPLMGAVERSLNGMAFAQMWRHYDIPRFTTVSSDAKVPDYQCAYEKTMQALLLSLAGYNAFSFPGVVYDELTWSLVVALMDADILGMIGRIVEGIKVTDETLAVDVINQVGPVPGHFLGTAHTRKWWNQEFFVPKLADRHPHPEWVELGSKTTVQRAKERLQDILATHQPTPLTEDQDKAVDEVLEEARSHYRQLGAM